MSTHSTLEHNLLRAHETALKSQSLGKHPFGAILVAPDDTTILLEQGNISVLEHAESTLAQRAFAKFSPDYLWTCKLYTTVEPCCMCAGAIYWANIGSVIFGISETELLSITGNHTENPTLNLDCRTVFSSGQKAISVIGPVPSLKNTLLKIHHEFWTK